MIDTGQLKEYIVEPTLEHIGMHSDAAVNLLLGTAAVESEMGRYLHQKGGGPALGIYQVEPATYESILNDYLLYRPELKVKVFDFYIPELGEKNLIGNLYFATAIARIKYYWCPKALPDKDDIEGLARYWRNVYNSPLGAFDDEKAINKFVYKYKKYVFHSV